MAYSEIKVHLCSKKFDFGDFRFFSILRLEDFSAP